jgi:hypothetical protein
MKVLQSFSPRLTQNSLMKGIPLQKEIVHLLSHLEDREKKGISPFPLQNPSVQTQKIAHEIASLTSFLNPVELVTIDNVSQVKHEFLENLHTKKEQNPCFSYKQSLSHLKHNLRIRSLSLPSLQEKLQTLLHTVESFPQEKNAESVLHRFLADKIRSEILTCDMVHALEEKNDTTMKETLKKKYPVSLSPEFLEALDRIQHSKTQDHAQTLKEGIIPREFFPKLVQKDMRNSHENLQKEIQKNPECQKYYFTAEEIQDAFLWSMKEYAQYYEQKHLSPFPQSFLYPCDISDAYSDIDVRDKSSSGPMICVPKSRIIDGKKLLELIAHEIESHWRQSVNGVLLFEVSGGALKIDDEALYEGLALNSEDTINRTLFGIPDRIPDPLYSRAYALAQEQKSFREIFHTISEILFSFAEYQKFSKTEREDMITNQAWKITYRILRGHHNTENTEGYGFGKDIGYFYGTILQKQLCEYSLDFLNEAGIFSPSQLLFVSKIDITPKDLPLPYLHITEKFFEKKMRKRMMNGE